MPFYNYLCSNCVRILEESLGRPSTPQEQASCVFETRHPLYPTKEEVEATTRCPDCQSLDTAITMLGTQIMGCQRGGSWAEYRENNRMAMSRDMAIRQLTSKDDAGRPTDPYNEHRQPGEVDDLTTKLNKSKLRNPNRIYFT